jgi:hypothetical protein
MKRIISGAAMMLVLLDMVSPMAMAATSSMHSFKMTIAENGTVVSSPYGIAQSDGSSVTTYVSVYYVNQALTDMGYQVNWNGTLKTWGITTNQTGLNFSSVPLGLGNTYITVNGTLVSKLNTVVQPDPIGGVSTTYVPIYYLTPLLKALGITAVWNGNAHTWTLTSSSSNPAGGSTTTTTSTGSTTGTSTGTSTSTATPSPTLVAPSIALANNNASTNIAVSGAISGAVVTLYDNSGNEVVAASANTSGIATFYNVASGSYYVVQASNGAVSGKSNEVTVSNNANTVVPTIYSSSSNGFWYIAVNNATANATVTLYTTNGNSVATATANQYGFAAFYNVGLDSYYVVVNSNSGNIQSNAITVNSQNSGATTTTTTTTLTTPYVTSSDNGGIYSLTVDNVQPNASVTLYTSSGTVYGTLIANASGTATWNNATSGTYYAVQTVNGVQSADSNEVTVTVSSLSTPYLTVNNNSNLYSVSVSNVEPNAIITIYNSAGTVYGTLTASTAGTATLNNVASGTYYAVQTWNGVQSGESSQVTVSATASTTPYLTVNNNNGAYSLTVSNVQPNATVTLYTSSGTVYATLVANSSGTATMNNMASGTYYAVQTWNGVQSASSSEVTVSSTLPQLTVYDNVQNNSGYITVSGAEYGATVDLYNSNGTLYTTAVANSSGYATFSNVNLGTYYVLETYNGQQSTSTNVVIS